jgi:hypothetical protein
MVQIELPLPQTLLEVTWFLIGFFAGRAGAQCDHKVKETEWYNGLCPMQKYLVDALLDFTHHFWIGLLLMVYAVNPEMYWFGMGLFVDDMPDIPSRFRKWFGYLAVKLHGFLARFI